MENLTDARPYIRLSKSSIGQEEKDAVLRVLDKEYLGMGVEVQNFEKILTDFFSRPAICVVNGTAALQLAIEACDIGDGDEILVQSLTYVASFQAISATGAKPVACDVDANTLTININDAEKRLTKNTKAIMPVHYSGGVGNLDEIYNFAKKHNLRVIEDAAHAFGSKYQGDLVGSIGDIVCFSFDGIKNITSGEGGCVVTSDEIVLQRVRDSRLLGVERDSENRYAKKRSWSFDVSRQGWRYHMSDLMASIGICQINKIKKIREKRQLIAKSYLNFFKNSNNIYIIKNDFDEIVPHIFPIRIFGLKNRNGLQAALEKKGIQTGYHYQPNHELTFYKNIKSFGNLIVTEEIFGELLTLPMHMDLNESDIEYIAKSLLELVPTYC